MGSLPLIRQYARHLSKPERTNPALLVAALLQFQTSAISQLAAGLLRHSGPLTINGLRRTRCSSSSRPLSPAWRSINVPPSGNRSAANAKGRGSSLTRAGLKLLSLSGLEDIQCVPRAVLVCPI